MGCNGIIVLYAWTGCTQKLKLQHVFLCNSCLDDYTATAVVEDMCDVQCCFEIL